jgi:uncharacterized protein with FMN-binding domain
MRRAVPAIALSAAGVTALLYQQRVIDVELASMTVTAGGSSQNGSSSGGSNGGSSGGKTVDGDTITTDFGPVQVAAVVQDGKLTDVRALKIPQEDANSKRINAEAVPVLREAAIKAQSAKIDAVSGATHTSDGYKSSLQTALDKAEFHPGGVDDHNMAAMVPGSSTTAPGSTTTAAAGATTTVGKGGSATTKAGQSTPTTKGGGGGASTPAGGGGGGMAAGGTATYNGSPETQRWGPVQVQITVSGHRITAAKMLQSPSESPSSPDKANAAMTKGINDDALPQLLAQTVSAQGKVAAVSGATLTSGAYIKSLANAVEQAKAAGTFHG